LGSIPLVIGPCSGRAGWAWASEQMGVPVEYVNYEKLRGFRKYSELRGRSLTNTEWLEEVPYGSGSFLRFKNNYDLVIFDEVHRCGGSTSLNSKALIAARRQARLVLTLSATAADDPRQMKALGYALGLHDLNCKRGMKQLSYMSWLLRHGCAPGVFGGFDFTADKEKQAKVFEKLHHEIFPRHGARLRKTEIPGFPETKLEIMLLPDDDGKAEKYAQALHEANEVKSLEDVVHCKQHLEMLMVPSFLDLAEDYSKTSKVVFFVSYTDTLWELFDGLERRLGKGSIGYISGAQAGEKGFEERKRYVELFQQDQLAAIVVNSQAGGESIGLHGKMDRTVFAAPCESGRMYKQLQGRVNRSGGGFSLQFLCFFAGTYQEGVANRVRQKNFNLDLLNDAEFLV
jgi:superfamily II DNA or RNA helicase